MERLSDDAGMFKDFVHRMDVPQRTDLTLEPPSPSVKERLYTAQQGTCNGCGEAMDARHLEVDHIVPKAKGGGDHYANYQLLCGNCNRIKGARPMEYLRLKIRARQELLRHTLTFGG